jgi:hypothetical protein
MKKMAAKGVEPENFKDLSEILLARGTRAPLAGDTRDVLEVLEC